MKNQFQRDARVFGVIPGVLIFVDRHGPEWEQQVFPFKARSLSTTLAVLTASVRVRRDERLAMRFHDVGIRRGYVDRVQDDCFQVAFIDAEWAGAAQNVRVDWLRRYSRGEVENLRTHKRVVPRTSAATLTLDSETRLPCRIIDMSRSGVAVRVDHQPTIGRMVAIGALVGRVARLFEGGFAIKFLELVELEGLEGMLTLETTDERRLARTKVESSA